MYIKQIISKHSWTFKVPGVEVTDIFSNLLKVPYLQIQDIK